MSLTDSLNSGGAGFREKSGADWINFEGEPEKENDGMELTSDGKRMLAWAEKNNTLGERDRIFAPADDSADSYYEKREGQEPLLYEFDFDDFLQIKDQLQKLWEGEPAMQEMALISAVSAMKHKPAAEEAQTGQTIDNAGAKPDGEFEIPEYVYVF